MVRGLARKRRRDIARQRWQFIAVLVTVVLGVMMFAASFDAYENLNVSYQRTYERLAFADMTVVGGDVGLRSVLARVEGVAQVAERRQADVPIKVGDHVLLGRVVSIPSGTQPTIGKLDVTAGSYPPLGSKADTLVETHMASHFGLGPGDAVAVLTPTGWTEVSVTGVAVSPEYLWPARSNEQFFESQDDFGVLFVTRDVLDAVDPTLVVPQTLVLYETDADSSSTDSSLRAEALSVGASDVIAKADQPSNKGLSLDVTGFQQMAVFFPAMFLLAAALAAYTLLTRVVHSQRSVIGTLRANGLGKREIVAHYVSYGLWLGFAGALLGVTLGVPAGWAMTAEYTAELGIPDTIRELRWLTPVAGLVFGVLVGGLSSWVPARAAVRVAPAEALRGDVLRARGRVSLIERLVPALRRAPVGFRMVFRGIGRSKRRSLSVVLGVVLAMTLVFSAWGMADTTRILLDRHFNEVEKYDAALLTSVPVDDDLLSVARGVAGVSRAEAVVALDCSVKGPDGTYSTKLFSFDEDTQVHGFISRDGKRPSEGALIGRSVGRRVGAEVGDTVAISLPGLRTTIEARVEDIVTEPMGSPVYVTRQLLEDLLTQEGVVHGSSLISQPGASIAEVQFSSAANRSQVLEELARLEGVVSVSDGRAVYELVNEYMGLFYLFVGIMSVFGGVLALALVFNIVSVNLAERTGELATMRANGLSYRRIGALVMAENVVLTAVGVVPGMAVAYAAASWLMATYSSDMLDFRLETRASTLVLSALSMFLVTTVSVWPGMRAVRRLDLATEVRERSQ